LRSGLFFEREREATAPSNFKPVVFDEYRTGVDTDRLGAHLRPKLAIFEVLISRRHTGVMSPALSVVAFLSESHPPMRSI
jgi:hypothetical protein